MEDQTMREHMREDHGRYLPDLTEPELEHEHDECHRLDEPDHQH